MTYLEHVVNGIDFSVASCMSALFWVLEGFLYIFGWPFALISWLKEK